jgi:hypothetical protein
MRLPNKDDQTQKIPYILLQFLTGKDDKTERDRKKALARYE